MSYTTPVGTDNCSGATTALTAGLNSGDNFPLGVTTVTYTVTAANGATATCSFTVTVVDNQAPQIVCPANKTAINNEGLCSAAVPYSTPIFSNNCSGSSLTQTAGLPSGSPFPVGQTTNVFKVTAANGQTSTCFFRVTVFDFEAPVITCDGDTYVNNDEGSCGAYVALNTPSLSDNCAIDESSLVNNAPGDGVYQLGENYVTWTVTDVNGNTNECTQLIYVTDAEAPFVQCTTEETTAVADPGECFGTVQVTGPDYSDNCYNAYIYNDYNFAEDASGIYAVGTTVITWYVSDDAGNESTCSQTVTVTDDQAPVIECPEAVTANTDEGQSYATLTLTDPVTSDNCEVASLTNDHPSDHYDIGLNHVVWTVTDIHGNTASCTQTVIVNDGEFPFIECGEAVTVNNDAGACDSNLVTLPVPYAWDNSGQVSVSVDYAGITLDPYDQSAHADMDVEPHPHDSTSAIFPVGTTTLVWSAADSTGNTTYCTQTIKVIDNENPLISCPSDITQTADAGLCGAVLDIGTPVTSDNCGVAGVISDHPSHSYPVGSTVVVWTVTDIHDNSSTCAQTIEISDDEIPVVSCPADITHTADSSYCSYTVDAGTATATDNCEVSHVDGVRSDALALDAPYPVGTTTIEWTATDIHGNVSVPCTQTIVVTDNEKPSIACASDQTQTADAGVCNAGVKVISPETGDNCAVSTVVNDYNNGPNASGTYIVGSTVVVWTVTDIHGNTNSCSQTITVTDDEVPSISCAADQTQTADGGVCNAAVTVTGPATGDNCAVATVVNDYTGTSDASGTYNVGTTVVLWTVTDASGNTNTCTQTIIVTDNEVPSITCASNQTQTADGGVCNAAVTVVAPATGDNCAVATVVNDHTGTSDASGTYNVGTTAVVWTVTDIHANSSSCTQTITVTDDEKPSISCAADQTQTADGGVCNAAVTVVSPATNDNCAVATVTNSFTGTSDASGTYNVGTTAVIWTVTDIHGNSSSCTQTITVTDDEKPSISCAANQTQTADAGVCNAAVTVVAPSTADNCAVAGVINNYTNTSSANGTYPVGTTIITWTVTDAHSNTASCSQTVTVTDDEKPSIACAANQTQTADAHLCSAAVTVTGPATADNCAVQSVVNGRTGTSDASGVYPVGSTVVVWTVTDIHGNTNSCSQTITVTDDEKPSITCPFAAFGGSIFRPANAGRCYATITVPPAVTSDNCGVQSVVNDFNGTSNASGDYPVGLTTITWTVTDIHGNTNTCQDFILVIDTQKPVVHTRDITVYLNSNGFVSITPTDIDNGSTDNCSIVSRTLSKDIFTCGNIGANTVVLTVTDASGNQQTGSAVVTVRDTVKPLALCQNVTVQLDGSGHATVAPSQVSNGSSDACGIASLVLTKTGFDCSNTGSNPVVLTVTDNNGNSASCSSVITVQDTRPPTAVCQNITVALDGTGHASITGTDVAGASTDNCSIKSIIVNPSSFSCSNVGANSVTVIVTDASDNNSFCFATVTIVDNTPPAITCPASITHTADAGLCSYAVNIGTATATDNCTVASVTGTRSDAAALNAPYPVGTTTVTWKATDNNGNTTTCTQTITVTDDEKPVVTCAPNQTQTTDGGVCNAAVTVISPARTDNCGIASVVNDYNGTDNASGTYNVGTTAVVWTVTDIHANSSSCTQTITVTDDEKPSITCAADQTQTADGGVCNAAVTVVGPATGDNCAVATVTNSFTGTDNASGTYNVGTTAVVWTVTDIHGNVSSCTQTITVTDDEKPSITCAANQTQTADGGVCNAAVTVVGPATGDNCAVATVTNSFTGTDNASGTYNVGTTAVVWTVTDIHGNVSSCTQMITVTDDEKPSITCAANQTQTADGGVCNAAVTVVGPATGDNCAVATVTNSFTGTDNASGTYNVGTTAVVWTVTDIHGNVSSCTQMITVTDDEKPSITCAANQTQTADGGVCNAAVTVIGPATGDNCAVATVTNSFTGTDNASGTYNVGTTAVVWTVTDIHGNVSSCTQTITVTDDEKPSISCAANQTQTADGGVCNAAVTVVGPATADNCAVATVTNSFTGTDNASGTYNVGTTAVVWTVTDIHGNVSSCTQTITVTDDEKPSITCAADQTQTADGGVCNAAVTVVGPATGDNCAVATVTNSFTGTDNASGTYNVGTTAVVWTVTDIHGNVSSCTQTITVTDDEKPVVTCAPNQTQTADGGVCNAAVTVVGPATNDNCAVATVTNSFTGTDNASGTYNVGTTAVVWTVTDIHGNVSSCTQTITVTDDEKPSITCAADQTQTADGGVCNAAVTVVGPATGDNCAVATVTNSFTGTDNASGTYNVGTTAVVWTVTDIHGNVSSCTQMITVTDDEKPSITCAANQTQTADGGVCNAAVTVTGPATNDNCAVATVTNSFTGTDNASGTYNVGTTAVVWTVTDIHGNVSSCTQTITVTDDEKPSISCAANQTQTADGGVCNAAVTVTGPATNDNCAVATVTNSFTGTDNASGTYNVGTTAVVWTVTDIHGNVSSCTQTITVTDDEKPSITCAANQTQTADGGVCNAAVTVVGPATGDNCAVATVTNSFTGTDNASGTYNVGTTAVVWTVTDIHGNVSSCTQTITVTDDEKPSISCAANQTQTADGGVCNAAVTVVGPATETTVQ